MSDLSEQPQVPKSWDQPAGASFASWLEGRVARFSSRKYDFDALKFENLISRNSRVVKKKAGRIDSAPAFHTGAVIDGDGKMPWEQLLPAASGGKRLGGPAAVSGQRQH